MNSLTGISPEQTKPPVTTTPMMATGRVCGRVSGKKVSDLLGGHSHDPADQVDDALEADAAGRNALLISLVGLGLTAAIQAVVAVLSGSVLLGDTLHNVANALTPVPFLVAFALARRPPTKRYTYGYGRAEDLGGVVVVVMIELSSELAYVAVTRLLHPRDVTHLWAVAAAAIVGFAGNEIVARYRPARTVVVLGARRHERGQDIVGVPVEIAAGPVVPHRGSEVDVPGGHCTSRRSTPPSSMVVTTVCLSMCGCVRVVCTPLASAKRWSRRVAQCRYIRLPVRLHRIGPSARSPTARSMRG